jgi:hypothetical protein
MIRFDLGDRTRTVVTRLASLTFGISLALFESEPYKGLSDLSDKLRALLRMPGGRHKSKGVQVPGQQPTAILSVGPDTKPRSAFSDQRPPIPVIFIHQGDSEHLTYSLAQAKKANPDSTVYLLGDASNNKYACVDHYKFADYFTAAAQFGRLYKHYSTHSVSFELICFQRWFILKEFLTAHKLDECVYLDSDVLLYANVTDDMAKFSRFDFTLCWHTIGCVVFLNHLQGLERLCQFMMDIYAGKDKYHFDQMVAHFAVRRHNQLSGGACDMTALQLYNELHFGRVGEASHIIDGSVYDPNINTPHPGFEMENNIKRITWQNHYPCGTYLPTGETVRFNSLHFNGHAKSLMAQYCTALLTEPQSPSRATFDRR